MNIGFDLDGIFIDKPPFVPKWLIDRLYRNYDHMLSYRIPAKPEQWLRQITHASIFRPEITENLQAIKSANMNDYNKYYLVSSRFGFLKRKTEEIIKKYKLEGLFLAMYFNFDNQQPHVFKNTMIKKIKIDRYVDDDLPLLEFLAKENKKVVFYWLNKKQNRKLEENLFAVTELSDILR